MPNEYISVETLDAYMRNGSIDHKLDLDTLHRLPAADVVEVVRCKDCRYAQPYKSDSSKRKCVITNCCFGETYFCDYAIRMDGGATHAD